MVLIAFQCAPHKRRWGEKREMKKRAITLTFLIVTAIVLSSFLFVYNVKALGWISVTSPYNGQVVYQEDFLSISWSSEEAGSYVSIQLYYSGSYYTTIASNTVNSGSYSWGISSSLPTGSSYQIKITSASDSSVYDLSGYFYIYERSLSVTYPYSEATWYQGETYSISWSSTHAGNYVKIDLYQGTSYISSITSSTYNDGSYPWTIWSSISPGSLYKIKISSTSYETVYDYSSHFSITARYLSISSPQENDIWYIGESNRISWTSDAGGYVSIQIYRDGSYYSTISSGSSNSGSYQWTVPSFLPIDSLYQIKISSKQYSSVFDYSGYFSIDKRFIEIDIPSYQDTLFMGDFTTIAWDSKNAGDFVSVNLYTGGVLTSIIQSKTSNDGNYSWKIPISLTPGSSYTIKIGSIDSSNLYDYSDSFSILKRSISISAPTSGETWNINQKYLITWDSQNVGTSVDIELYKENVYDFTIASNVTNDGTYQWKIPGNLSGGSDYAIKVSSTSHENAFGFSEGYLSIEKALLHQWSNLILAIILCCFLLLLLLIIYILIKKRIFLLPRKKEDTQKAIDVPEEKQVQIPNGVISNEDFETIWENRR
jgi:hypothetical protein